MTPESDEAAAEERFRVLFEFSTDAHLVFNEAGIIDCNNAAIEMLRCRDKAQVLSLHPAELSPDLQPDGRRSLEKCIEMDTLARKHGYHRFEWLHRRMDGENFMVEVTLNPVTLRGEPALLVVWHDITERKRVENETECRLRQLVADLEEADRAKDDFLAKMSHEIRTPMNGVIGMTSLMLETQLTAEQRSYAEAVRGSAAALLSIVNDLLDISKIEAGMMTLEVVPFALRPSIDDVIGLLRPRATEKGITLSVEMDDNVPEGIITDPGRFRQIITNLVGNAIKFTSHGSVVIAVEATLVGPNGVRLRVSVKDTGVGIAADKIGSLFQKFVQADASTTRRHGGTGLGLAICKQLAALMGGTMGVESELGVGTTVWLDAKFTIATSSDEMGTESVDTPGIDWALPTDLFVLLAEDNHVNQVLTCRMLEKMGYRVDVANNGREACEMVRAKRYDVIFMDCQMPEMDGFEATTRIRAQRGEGANIPIIALTANAMPRDRQRCLDVGMDDYASKPISSVAIQEVLRRVLADGSTSDDLASAGCATRYA